MGDDSPLGGLGKTAEQNRGGPRRTAEQNRSGPRRTAEQNRGGLLAACGGVRHVR